MHTKKILFVFLILASFLFLVQPIAAQTGDKTVVYQTSFDKDPQWTTNSPSNYYWDPSLAVYHFSVEKSSGAYAYKVVDFDRGPFTLEYDILFTRFDADAYFGLGFSNYEMDVGKGPNVVTQFTNAKYGQIMWLHLVTNGNKAMDINSVHLPTELGMDAYAGPTVRFEVNKTYHVVVNYDDNAKTLGMRVLEKMSGKEIWSYYMNTWENLHGINRLYLGAVGVYGPMNIYSQGYIDNLRLSTPSVSPTVTTPPPVSTAPTYSINPSKTTTKFTITVPTSYPTETQKSPVSVIPIIGALGIIGVTCLLKRNLK